MTSEEEVIATRRGPLGILTLNRPKALNALTHGMVRSLDAQLRVWRDDPDVSAVCVVGAGDRAFCAGGDVIALAKDGDGVVDMRRDFFRDEYILNHLIHNFPKPYIPLIDGISMGGGVGVSVHGSHRIVSEKVLFAMPETAIGLFPDVGGAYFLPRLRGEVGTYLALTNSRLKLADVAYAGVYDTHVPSAEIENLIAGLADADWSGDGDKVADTVIAEFATHAGEPSLAAHQALIDSCFAHDSIEEILGALHQDGSEFALAAAGAIEEKSPVMSAVALRQLRLGATMSFDACMIMEYRLSQACMAGHEFFEGVRAMLIDKDRSPKWQPSTRVDVIDAMVAAFFEPPGVTDLSFAG